MFDLMYWKLMLCLNDVRSELSAYDLPWDERKFSSLRVYWCSNSLEIVNLAVGLLKKKN